VNEALLRHAIDVTFRNLALGHETFEAAGATFVRSVAFRRIYDANFAFGINAATAAALDRLMDEARDRFSHAARVTFRCDPFTPPIVEARLALDEFERRESLVMLLEGSLSGTPSGATIREAKRPQDWADYRRLKEIDWLEHATRLGIDSDVELPRELAASNAVKCPPACYFLAYDADRPVGFCQAWEGIGGCGQIEDLFVEPSSRRRGIATALLQACVAEARSRGAGPVVLVADPADTPKQMYARLGWRPIAVCRQYGKWLPPRTISPPDIS
jgi:ribosomal protein S18 acetylase RimI-like enzyme